MSEEDKPKKRKIDLKARLSTVRSAAPGEAGDAAFPPAPRGSVPPPKVLSGPGGIMPPPGLIPGPFAPAPEPEKKVSAEQQTIKVEVGEEIFAERKRWRVRLFIVSFLTLAAGGGVGFGLGMTKSKGDVAKEERSGAAQVAVMVERDKDALIALSTAVEEAQKQLRADKYPKDLVETIKGVSIPFDMTRLQPRWLAGLGDQAGVLLRYGQAIEDVKSTRDKVVGLLNMATFQKDFAAYVADKEKPTVHFAVSFNKSDKGAVAELVKVTTPFAVGEAWPNTLALVRIDDQGNEKNYEAERWAKGEILGEKAIGVPVDLNTVPTCATEFDKDQAKQSQPPAAPPPGAQCTTIQSLKRQATINLGAILQALEGKGIPGQEVEGLIKLNSNITAALAKRAGEELMGQARSSGGPAPAATGSGG